MKKREFSILFLIPFLLLGVGLGYGQYRRRGIQAERDAIMVRFFKHRFASIQYRNGNVVMTPKFHFGPSWNSQQPKVLKIGDKFEFPDRHWRGKFEVTSIEPHSISIAYERNGEHPSLSGYWTGQIKLSTH